MKSPLFLFILTVLAQGQDPWTILTKQADERQAAEDLDHSAALRWEALHCAEKQLGENSIELVFLSTQLGATLHLKGQDAEAEPVLRHSLEIAKTSGDEKQIGVALNALGSALSGQGEKDRAEPILRRSLALLQKAEGDRALDTANAANNLAALYSDIGEYSEAEETMKFALSFYEDHPNSVPTILAMGLRNMFVIIFKQRRVAEAEPYLMRALAIGEKCFPQSRRMGELKFADGLLETSLGRFQQAAATLKQAIEIQERLLGAQSPELAHTLIAYSDALRHLHRRGEAHDAEKRGNVILKSFVSH